MLWCNLHIVLSFGKASCKIQVSKNNLRCKRVPHKKAKREIDNLVLKPIVLLTIVIWCLRIRIIVHYIKLYVSRIPRNVYPTVYNMNICMTLSTNIMFSSIYLCICLELLQNVLFWIFLYKLKVGITSLVLQWRRKLSSI